MAKPTLTDLKKTAKYPLRQATLLFIVNGDKVLLAMKKRGFGEGKFNGVGGKQQEGETIEQTAIRETQEEIGLTPLNLKKHAVLDFYFQNNRDWDQRVHVYVTSEWQREPSESEEMKPKWFDIKSLPFDKMWEDDPYWLPHILEGRSVYGEFIFDGHGMLDYVVNKDFDLNKLNQPAPYWPG